LQAASQKRRYEKSRGEAEGRYGSFSSLISPDSDTDSDTDPDSRLNPEPRTL